MLVKHHINEQSQLIVTTIKGEVTDVDLIDAINSYHREIRNEFHYANFNEIVDFSKVSKLRLSLAGLRTLARIAPSTDSYGQTTKLAVIVNSKSAYLLGKTYQAYRDCHPKANKKIAMFERMHDAAEWILISRESELAEGWKNNGATT